MKTKKILVGVLCVSLVGCTSMLLNRPANLTDVVQMRLDCLNAEMQINWLTRQRMLNQNMVYQEKITAAEGRTYEAVAALKIWQLRSECK